jgi:uncharacterized protein with HEPN domain
MIIGEAANRIPVDLQSRYPEVPWRDLAALRNRIVHDYPGIDLELVWALIRGRLGKRRENVHEWFRYVAGATVAVYVRTRRVLFSG